MPEYFFHIGLEFLPKTDCSRLAQPSTPIDLTSVFKALHPFTRSSAHRLTKPLSFNRKSDGGQRAATRSSDPVTTDTGAGAGAGSRRLSPINDHRADKIRIGCVDMEPSNSRDAKNTLPHSHIEKGIGHAMSGVQTKGRYEPLVEGSTSEEWGIVHLYRDAVETPGLYRDSVSRGSGLWSGGSGVVKPPELKPNPPAKDEECSTLCILAVPSYFTPGDFLAFVGEDTRNAVSHFRMIKTARANRYMVLMKFKHGRTARDWQYEWNGKVFNSMEPETCHVVFLKSVEIVQQQDASANPLASPDCDGTSTYPRISNDPFVAAVTSTKPQAPRTPALIELPTCPVCLERMDETAGLLTILCQHVFHCTCLQKWSGGGCPVCRYTHDDFTSKTGSIKHKTKTFGSEYDLIDQPLKCEYEGCGLEDNLWQCLICGKAGCGRYAGKHAYRHFEETGHTFSMDLVNKRVWDYAADVYVHRIIQDAAKPGEKLVELPGSRREVTTTALEADGDMELAKMENVALEYTHLLTSQLESQRVYFESIVERAVDKASQAGKLAEHASADCELFRDRYDKLVSEHDELLNKLVPELQNTNTRLEKRSARFEEMAKSVNTKYLEEKSLASSLMERIQFFEDIELVALRKKVQELEEDSATKSLLMEGLQDEHRDAMFQLSAQARLKEMVERGEIDQEDLVGATVSTGPAKKSYGRNNLRDKNLHSVQHDSSTDNQLFFVKMWLEDAVSYELGPKWDDKFAIDAIKEIRAEKKQSGKSNSQLKEAWISKMVDKQLLLKKSRQGNEVSRAPVGNSNALGEHNVLLLIGLEPTQYQIASNWDSKLFSDLIWESQPGSAGSSVRTLLEGYRNRLLEQEVIISKVRSSESNIRTSQSAASTDTSVQNRHLTPTSLPLFTRSDLRDSILPLLLLLDLDPRIYQAGPNWNSAVVKEVCVRQSASIHHEALEELADKLLTKGLIIRTTEPGKAISNSEVDDEMPVLEDLTTIARKKKSKGKKKGGN